MASAGHQQLTNKETSAAPWLVAAPKLIEHLGWCMAIASTREVARIKLNTKNLESTDLATNLVQIADEGQNAFMDAYSDLLDISNRSNAMCRDGGYLDRLEDSLGDPSSDRTAQRNLSRISESIKECEQAGHHTEKQFKSWRSTVQKVKRALVATQNSTTGEIEDLGVDMTAIQKELLFQNVVTQQATAKLRDVRKEYQDIKQLHQQREAALKGYVDHAVGCATLGLTAGMIGAIIGTAGSAAMLAFSGNHASTLEAEVLRKAQLSQELELEMAKLKIDFDSCKTETERLDQMRKIIGAVCRLLEGLCNDIVMLLTLFTQLHSLIKNLVKEHRDMKESAEALEDDMDDNATDGVPSVDESTYHEFRNHIVEMKKLSLEIHILSGMYSEIITLVITPGFSKVVEASYDDHGDTNTSVVLHDKQSYMSDYASQATLLCRSKLIESNTKLVQRLSEIEIAQTSTLKRTRAKRQKKTSNAVAGKKSGGLLKRIFSRG